MPKGTVLFEKKHKKKSCSGTSEDDNEDIWDDTLLINAYDKAHKLMKEQVAQRLAMKTNSTGASKQNKKSSSTPQKEDCVWEEGDYCRCTYSEDGIDYEAEILSIDGSQCTVKYFGYDNEEVVDLGDLMPSDGDHARKSQLERAKSNGSLPEVAFNGDDNGVPIFLQDTMPMKKSKSKKKSPYGNANHSTRLNGLPSLSSFKFPPFMPSFDSDDSIPIPPPPMPFFPNVGGRDSSEEDQALTSMLMSWYMSGYYTGLYQGQKQAMRKQKLQKEK